MFKRNVERNEKMFELERQIEELKYLLKLEKRQMLIREVTKGVIVGGVLGAAALYKLYSKRA